MSASTTGVLCRANRRYAGSGPRSLPGKIAQNLWVFAACCGVPSAYCSRFRFDLRAHPTIGSDLSNRPAFARPIAILMKAMHRYGLRWFHPSRARRWPNCGRNVSAPAVQEEAIGSGTPLGPSGPAPSRHRAAQPTGRLCRLRQKPVSPLRLDVAPQAVAGGGRLNVTSELSGRSQPKKEHLPIKAGRASSVADARGGSRGLYKLVGSPARISVEDRHEAILAAVAIGRARPTF